MKKTKYRRVLWLLPLLCAAALIPLFLRGSFPRLEVAGFRITEEEYLRAMYQARNDVLSDHAAAGISLKDWSAETPLGDPCDLAINYGRAWAAVGNLMPRLERVLVIKKQDIDVECDFTASQTTICARLDLTITLGRILAIAVVYGFRAVVEFIKINNKRKGGASK